MLRQGREGGGESGEHPAKWPSTTTLIEDPSRSGGEADYSLRRELLPRKRRARGRRVKFNRPVDGSRRWQPGVGTRERSPLAFLLAAAISCIVTVNNGDE